MIDRLSSIWALAMRALVKWIITVLFRVSVRGRENIPPGGYLLVANHLSWLDGFLLLTFLPSNPRLYLLADKNAIEQRWWKRMIVGSVGRVITIDRSRNRGDGSALKEAQRVLNNGEVLALFPEGKVGYDEGKVAELKRGVGALCLHSARQVLAVGLSGVSELYLGKEIVINIGVAIRPSSSESTIPARINDITGQVRKALESTIPAYTEKAVARKRMLWLTNLF
ncbi:MAG: 1-acyl-sn-glycerol-3-phosphate acyltransferase [Dehalococcoidia bacterium]|nr:1-acyl-sn-glycerol-3-phosphate acyltransferase [Dehalococcoidia bacterium]